MKKYFLLSLLTFLAGCASTPWEPIPDQGITCRPYKGEQTELKKKSCISVDYDTNPVRFHYVPEWDRDNLPDMPELF